MQFFKVGGDVAKLNDKHKRFCEEYLIDLNATQAYIRAGYKVSEKVAAVNATRLMALPRVQAYISARQQELQHKTGITQERVLAEIEKVGFAEAADYTDATLKYSNKLKALEMLAKHLGLFDSNTIKAPPPNNLFEAINDCAKGEYDELSEIQQETETDTDMVE